MEVDIVQCDCREILHHDWSVLYAGTLYIYHKIR